MSVEWSIFPYLQVAQFGQEIIIYLFFNLNTCTLRLVLAYIELYNVKGE